MAAAAMKCSARRRALQRAMSVIQEMIQINEMASRLESTLVAQGVVTAEIESTLNKILDSGGPPSTGSAVAIPACTDDTLSGRLVDIINGDLTDGISWTADTEV